MVSKIFIISLPRTGTTSICVTFLELGYKVAHISLTKKAFETAEVVADAPCFSDFRQLDSLFPNSKFIYIERSIESWLPSMKMLLTKMLPHLAKVTGKFNPVLKRSINETFSLSKAYDPISNEHLTLCYTRHKKAVYSYFCGSDNFLTIRLDDTDAMKKMLDFLSITHPKIKAFPKYNVGVHVANWKEYKHPNKVNSNLAGPEHRKFFDYKALNLSE